MCAGGKPTLRRALERAWPQLSFFCKGSNGACWTRWKGRDNAGSRTSGRERGEGGVQRRAQVGVTSSARLGCWSLICCFQPNPGPEPTSACDSTGTSFKPALKCPSRRWLRSRRELVAPSCKHKGDTQPAPNLISATLNLLLTLIRATLNLLLTLTYPLHQ